MTSMLLTASSGAAAILLWAVIARSGATKQSRSDFAQPARDCFAALAMTGAGSQLTLQESVGRFLSPAYFLAAASIIGRTSFWSESIQSETKFQPLPSHWKTRAVAMPVWLAQVTFSG